jgi:PAS domain S-box-containing protein
MREQRLQEFWEKLGRGEFDAREYLRFGKGGKEIWIQASYNPIIGRNGKPYKVVKFATDITEAKLKAADDEGKIAAISRAQAMIEFDTSGQHPDGQREFLRALGYDLSEIKGKHHSMFVDPSYARSDEYKDFWDKLRGGEFVAEEFKRIGKGGKEIWIQASYNPILDSTAGDESGQVRHRHHRTRQARSTRSAPACSNSPRAIWSSASTKPFIPSLDQLRLDFNNSIEKLQEAMQRVGENATAIRSASDEIRSAADDLSRRTEQQAASVEETAAAVEEVTASVKESAGRAEEAGTLVSRTKASAEKSGEVVRQAVAAMERDRGLVAPDRQHHRHDRRDRLPDQPAGAERGRRGGAGRRGGQGLCRRRAGSARTGAALGQCGQGDQDADRHLLAAGQDRFRPGRRDRQGAGDDRRRGAGGQRQRHGDRRRGARAVDHADRKSTRRSPRSTRARSRTPPWSRNRPRPATASPGGGVARRERRSRQKPSRLPAIRP